MNEFQSIYRLVHPKKYIFILCVQIFLRSKYPINVFDFEMLFTGDTHRRPTIDHCTKSISPAWPKTAGKSTILNHLCQLNSLSTVASLWQKHHVSRQYSAVIYARPDVLYNCPLPVERLSNLQQDTVYMPSHSLGHGVNDRFAMLTPAMAAVYATRLSDTYKRCQQVRARSVHSEYYLAMFITDRHFKVEYLENFYFYRARIGNKLQISDVMAQQGCDRTALDKKYWNKYRGEDPRQPWRAKRYKERLNAHL